MGLQESRGKIGSGMRDLMALWSNTQVHWNDVNSHRLEETILRPLEMDVRVATSAMDQMASLLSSIKRECE
jgi:hypothetical protein